ncbi:MAG: hypothetical protein ACRDQW_07375 [Haloechinothrix sp.]
MKFTLRSHALKLLASDPEPGTHGIPTLAWAALADFAICGQRYEQTPGDPDIPHLSSRELAPFEAPG